MSNFTTADTGFDVRGESGEIDMTIRVHFMCGSWRFAVQVPMSFEGERDGMRANPDTPPYVRFEATTREEAERLAREVIDEVLAMRHTNLATLARLEKLAAAL